MRNCIVYILVFLLIVPIALAGTGRTINLDFSKEKYYVYPFFENDRVKFNMLDGEHTIIIDAIKKDGIDLDIFPYKQDVNYISLTNRADVIKVDLDKNGIHDLKIGLAKIENKKVWLVFEEINEQYLSNLTGRVLNPTLKKFYEDKNFIIAGIIGLIILIIIIILILKNKKK
jgi:hypothetical protein